MGTLPNRSKTTVSGMPSPLKSPRNGVSVRPTPPAATGSKVPSPLPRSTPVQHLVVADGDQVEPAVTVDIGNDSLDRRKVGGEGPLRPKRSVAVIQEHAHAVAAVVVGDDVELAVAGQVGHRHCIRPRGATVVLRRLECAVALLPMSTLTVLYGVGGDDVGYAVPRQVGHSSRKMALLAGCKKVICGAEIHVIACSAQVHEHAHGVAGRVRGRVGDVQACRRRSRRPPSASTVLLRPGKTSWGKKVPSPLPMSTLTVSSL